MLGSDIAIDMGTAMIKIYVDGKGVVVNEPAIVVYNVNTEEIVAIGHEASAMIGKTPETLEAVRPLSNGVVSHFGMAQVILMHYLKQLNINKVFMPRVVVSVPCGVTEVEKRAVVDAINSCGVRKICLIEEPVAAAMGAGVDLTIPHGCLVVDIGCGTTNIGALSLCDIAVSNSTPDAGDAFDDAIIRYVRRKYNLIIGKKTAEEVKMSIGCAYPRTEFVTDYIKGRNTMTGLPQWAEINCDEMLAAMIPVAMKIIKSVQSVLEMTPPEIVGDIYQDGIILTGGSANIYGLDILMEKKVKVPVYVAEDPGTCVVRGAGRALRFLDAVEKGDLGSLNPLRDAY